MNQDYVQGFMDKCAEAGVDAEALVKNAGILDTATNLGSKGWQAAKPVLKKLNPMNVLKGGKGWYDNSGKLSKLEERTQVKLRKAMPKANNDRLRAATSKRMLSDPKAIGLGDDILKSQKELAGGLAGTGAIAAGGYAVMPERRPPTLQERIEAAFARLTGR